MAHGSTTVSDFTDSTFGGSVRYAILFRTLSNQDALLNELTRKQFIEQACSTDRMLILLQSLKAWFDLHPDAHEHAKLGNLADLATAIDAKWDPKWGANFVSTLIHSKAGQLDSAMDSGTLSLR